MIRRLSTDVLAIGAGTQIFRNNTPYPTGGYSGNPVTSVLYKPVTATSPWLFIGDSNQLRKIRDDGKDFQWGILAPQQAAGASSTGTGGLNTNAAGAVTYDYRYTYANSETQDESNPSPINPTGLIAVNTNAAVTVQASPDPQVDTINLYRRGGTLGSNWIFTISGPNADGTILDGNTDSALITNNSLLLDNDVPFTSLDDKGNAIQQVPLPYIFGPFIGNYILAVGDPNRPGYLYWTNSQRPNSASTANVLQITNPSEPLLGGFIYQGAPYIFSKDNLYVVDYGGPNAVPVFSYRKTPIGMGTVGPFAFAVGPLIYFVSKDGIYETDGASVPVSITDQTLRPIFNGVTTEGLAALDPTQVNSIRLAYMGLEVHLFYTGVDGNTYHLYYHTVYKRWQQESPNGFSEAMGYQDENQSSLNRLFGGSDGRVYLASGTTDNGQPINWEVRTGSVDPYSTPQTLKEFGNIILDGDTGTNTVTVTPYLNAEASSLNPFTFSSNGLGRLKFPNTLTDTYGYTIAFDLAGSGTSTIYQFDLLCHQDTSPVTHWEYPESSHYQFGWMQVRDMYLALRSTANITMTITVDGVPYTYPVPPTGGAKQKVHIWLSPIKGRVFKYALDSVDPTQPFRLYGGDCEVRVKQWNTNLGYNLVSPFREVNPYRAAHGAIGI